jgi:hypothetical protein
MNRTSGSLQLRGGETEAASELPVVAADLLARRATENSPPDLSVGNASQPVPSPARDDRTAHVARLFRPWRDSVRWPTFPSDESLGYFRPSLRDQAAQVFWFCFAPFFIPALLNLFRILGFASSFPNCTQFGFNLGEFGSGSARLGFPTLYHYPEKSARAEQTFRPHLTLLTHLILSPFGCGFAALGSSVVVV